MICSKCGKTLDSQNLRNIFPNASIAGFGTASDFDMWRAQVCTNCHYIFCGDCIKLGFPTPCPACGKPTEPAYKKLVNTMVPVQMMSNSHSAPGTTTNTTSSAGLVEGTEGFNTGDTTVAAQMDESNPGNICGKEFEFQGKSNYCETHKKINALIKKPLINKILNWGFIIYLVLSLLGYLKYAAIFQDYIFHSGSDLLDLLLYLIQIPVSYIFLLSLGLILSLPFLIVKGFRMKREYLISGLNKIDITLQSCSWQMNNWEKIYSVELLIKNSNREENIKYGKLMNLAIMLKDRGKISKISEFTNADDLVPLGISTLILEAKSNERCRISQIMLYFGGWQRSPYCTWDLKNGVYQRKDSPPDKPPTLSHEEKQKLFSAPFFILFSIVSMAAMFWIIPTYFEMPNDFLGFNILYLLPVFALLLLGAIANWINIIRKQHKLKNTSNQLPDGQENYPDFKSIQNKKKKNYPLFVALTVVLAGIAFLSLFVIKQRYNNNINNEDAVYALSIDSIKQGNIVSLGSYEQDNNLNNGKEPVKWRVLAVEEDRAMLISEDVVDVQPYNTKSQNVTWESSTIRIWLNNVFLTAVFTSEEQKSIVMTTVKNSDNLAWDTEGGSDTEDKIFLLSMEEASKYFTSVESRCAKPTTYAVSRGVNIYEYTGDAEWWLRTPGYDSSRACFIYGGFIDDDSINKYVDSTEIGVRPVFWLYYD